MFRIVYRLLAWFLVLALIPLAVVTLIIFTLSRNAQKAQIEDNLVAIANSKVLQIEAYALERQRDVSSLALTSTLIQALGPLEGALAADDPEAYAEALAPIASLLMYYQQETGYENVMLFSNEGLLLFSLEEKNSLGINYHQDYEDVPPELLKVLDNARTLLETEISNFDQSRAFIAAPMLDQGVVVGMVVIEINQEAFYEVVTERTGLGQTGETMVGLQDGEQVLITAPLYHDPDAAFQRNLEMNSSAAAALVQAIHGIQGQGEMQDYRQKEVVAAWRYLPSLRWGMVVKIDRDEAYASLQDQQNSMMMVGAFTLFFVILAALTVADNLSQPIRHLTETLTAFRQGDLAARVGLKRQDEIGLLAEGFNEMAQQIANQVHDLEAQVAQRTQDLQEGNLQLSAIAAVSHEVSNLREPQDLLPLITSALQSRFGFYHVGIYLLEKEGELSLQAASGVVASELLAQRVAIDESSLVGWAATHRQMRLAENVHQDKHYLPNPRLPHTHSELVLPLVSDTLLLGVLDIQSDRANVLSEKSAPNFRTMADQITAALVNAQLYQQIQSYAAEMAEARYAADDANRAKSAFLSNMSHELRTPLNAVIGFSQVMQRDPSLTASQHEHLEIILRSGEHLLGLINDVLEMSKIEAGQISLTQSAFDLPLLLQSIDEMFRLRAEDKILQWICDYDLATLPQYIWTDEGKLRQILINLIGNAFKFTEEGGVTLRVSYQAETQHLMMEVEDSGPGIAEDELKKLFQPFIQTATGVKSQEGTGLGLAISRQFVQLMGGDIQVKSRVGVGTVFQFSVLVQEASVDDVKVEYRRRVAGVKSDMQYKMLVVDDRPDNRRLLREWLGTMGFAVEEAENGLMAIEKWESWEPHMIWMDMRMPIMDGYEATRRIKTTTKGMATVVIAFTASAFEHEQNLVLSAGCDDFVRKPARESEIFEMIAKHLGVELIYEEIETNAAKDERIEEAEVARYLQQLPPEKRAELREAAENIDMDEMTRLVQTLSDTRMVKELIVLIENFRFDLLQNWLEG